MTLRTKIGAHLGAILSALAIALLESYGHLPIDDKSRFLVLLIPIATVAWVSGVGPAITGLVLSSGIAAFFLPPKNSFAIDNPADVVSLVLFISVSIVVIGIIESLRRSRQALAYSEETVRHLNEDLKSSLTAKAEALERQRRFTSDVSHELKTPLTAIRARSGIALTSHGNSEELIDHILAVNRSADTMVSIVRDLMLLAASDEGKLPLHKEKCSVRSLVDDALASVDITSHSVESVVEPDIQTYCDPSAITRTIVNLLQNALTHTPSGGIIQVIAKENGDFASIEVRDEGSGIPPQDLDRVFDRFCRADRSRDRESGGSGLGLAIARAIVTAHDGKISLESTLGEGTTITVALPVLPEA